MYKARCFTNLDDFKREDWPDEFAFPPRVGDYVESRSGKRLKVVSIMHSGGYTGPSSRPLVVVELHR